MDNLEEFIIQDLFLTYAVDSDERAEDLLSELVEMQSTGAMLQTNCYDLEYKDGVYLIESVIEKGEKCEVDFETLKAALDIFVKEDPWVER